MAGLRGWRTALPLLAALLVAGCFENDGGGNTPPTNFSPSPDAQIFSNARIWTGNPAQAEAEAMVIENGNILFVGSNAEARSRYPHALVVDLGGKRVIPGLIDSHSHFVLAAAGGGLASVLGLSPTGWNCDPSTNPFLPNYDSSPAADARFQASRAAIRSFHLATNASDQTPVDYPGAVADKEAAERGLECAMKEAAAMGLTMSVEAGIPSLDHLDVLQSLERKGKVTMRQSLYLTPPLLDEAISRGIRNGHGSEWVRVAGIKYYSDGWLGPRTAALLEPYSDQPGRGVLFLEQTEADDWVGRAHVAGLKVATHAIGDHGVTVMLNAYNKTFADSPDSTGARPSLEHGSMIPKPFWPTIADLGVAVSFQHSFATSDQGFAESALGKQRLDYLYSWKSLIDQGVVLAGGSDFPVEVMPPLWGLQRVVTRQELDGTPPGGWLPEERLTVAEALQTVTWNAAYNVFMEDRLGSLEPGKLADFLVLDQDILTIPASDIAKTCIRATYVGGRLVYDGDGAGSKCPDYRYDGGAVKRDSESAHALHEQIEAAVFGPDIAGTGSHLAHGATR